MTKFFIFGASLGLSGVVFFGVIWRYGFLGWLGVALFMAVGALLYKKAVAA